MQVFGTILQVMKDTIAKTKEGKDYPAWKLVYEDLEGEIKSIVKHTNSLKYNQALSNGLDNVTVGDKFTLEQEKNDQGFWEPKSIIKGIKEVTKDKPTQGNWPTSEERINTQKYIIRQNCITNAVNFVNVTFVKKDQTVEQVISVAKQFETFIHTGEGLPWQSEIVSDDLDSGIE